MNRFLVPALVASVMALSGCASSIMEGYVGKPIEEPMMDYGPPTNVFELGAGRRAFQWQISTSGVVPMTSPSSATVFGPEGKSTMHAQTTTYVPYQNECFYTLTATKHGERYIVDGFRKPLMMCE